VKNDASILNISFTCILRYNSDSKEKEKINYLENFFKEQIIKKNINLKYKICSL